MQDGIKSVADNNEHCRKNVLFATVISFEICICSTLTPINLRVSILALNYIMVIELVFHEQSELVAIFLVAKPKKLVAFVTESVAISSAL